MALDSKTKAIKKKSGLGINIAHIEKQKKDQEMFDRGGWKPSKKGETFIQALEKHKANKSH